MAYIDKISDYYEYARKAEERDLKILGPVEFANTRALLYDDCKREALTCYECKEQTGRIIYDRCKCDT